MRWVATEKFQEYVLPLVHNIKTVAVVGGTCRDPEVKWLMENYPHISFCYFGVEEQDSAPFVYFDLNDSHELLGVDFDLVVCCHVFEHLFDIDQALRNLISMANGTGYVWINCPASCRPHGSPDFYACGYQPEIFMKLTEKFGAAVCVAERIGSRRAYFYEHTLRRWPDQSEFDNPIVFMTQGSPGLIKSFLRWFKYLPGRGMASMTDKSVTDDVDFSNQTVVLIRVSLGNE